MDFNNMFMVFVDYLMPELTPHEASMYMFLFRHSWVANESPKVRIGQGTIASKYGRGPKMAVPSIQHIKRQLEELEKKGCIAKFDTTREGTLFEIFDPESIPLVKEKMISESFVVADGQDYYHDPEKRKLIFERDKWKCQYCGDAVNHENATIDHFIPQCDSGSHDSTNLKTACLICNSIKSGKNFQEAEVLLLRNILERKIKS